MCVVQVRTVRRVRSSRWGAFLFRLNHTCKRYEVKANPNRKVWISPTRYLHKKLKRWNWCIISFIWTLKKTEKNHFFSVWHLNGVILYGRHAVCPTLAQTGKSCIHLVAAILDNRRNFFSENFWGPRKKHF